MGREAKILLGLLGLLAGVFCGVLSMKLFVHRPPAGAGPDVPATFAGDGAGNTRPAAAPPAFLLPASAFAAAPPLSPALVAGVDGVRDDGADSPVIAVRFDAVAEGRPVESAARFPEARGDRYESRQDATHVDEEETKEGQAFLGRLPSKVTPVVQDVPSEEPPHERNSMFPYAGATETGIYEVRPGDSWWNVAERAYGDGRFYRALFAWNRSVDPRVALSPGTRLEIPTLDRLTAAWPRLMPR